MKPAQFEYVSPMSLKEAISELQSDEFARPLAGGQSLIPTLNFRIASPSKLVDLNNIAELKELHVEGGLIQVGAMTRHRELELNEAVYSANPLIRETLGNVAHIVIRNRGTIGGNIAHADAASEMPCLLLAMEGKVIAAGPNGEREIAANDLFQFHMTTSLAPEEILTRIDIPVMPSHSGGCFQEFSRRKGDYAQSGVCAVMTLDAAGHCVKARLAACGVGSRAVRLTDVEGVLEGSTLSDEVISQAATVSEQYVNTIDERHVSQKYRQQLTATLVKRTVSLAIQRAKQSNRVEGN